MSRQRSLVGVKITIFDVGMTISKEWLDELNNVSGLWLLPDGCDSFEDCLSDGQSKVRRIYEIDGMTPSHEETYSDYHFDKWAVRFEFGGYSSEHVSGGYTNSIAAMEYEVYSMGERDIYQDCLHDLLDMVDDLIDEAVERRFNYPYQTLPPIYYISFTTLWEVDYYQSGYECPEWNSSYNLLGRVNLNKLAREMENEGVPA